MDYREFEKEERATLAAARKNLSKSMEGDESKAEYFDIADTVQDANNQPHRSVRVGDARVMPNKVTFMKPETRVYQTAGDMAVPRDSFLSPNLGEGASVKPQSEYVCTYPDGQHLHEENFESPDGESGIAPAADAQFPDAGVLKRAPMFADIIKGFTSGENS